MTKLLRKEFSLAMHPTAPFMVLLSAMVLIPNYPYVVIFFYVSMAIFFTCLLGRENNDIIYSLNLPIAKKDIVKARFGFTLILQLAQLVFMIPFVILSQKITPLGNQAGMDGNIALFGTGFIVYGLFNLIFFGSYYKNTKKVGIAFIKSSIMIFLVTVFDVVATYTIPFVRDKLDTNDSEFLLEKFVFLAIGFVIYLLLTLLVYKKSVVNFEKQDLN